MGSLIYKNFKSQTSLSEEKYEKLKIFFKLIKLWQKKFNLVSKNSFKTIWERHFLDSYQIIGLIGNKKKVLDIGSGAGFPAIVCAICSNNNFHLIESNKKKCIFLNEVKEVVGIKNISIFNSRIETIKIDNDYDCILARAVAPLDKLMNYIVKFYKKNMSCIFLKGKTINKEIEDAKKRFSFDLKFKKSITSDEGRILIVKNLKKK